MANTKQLQFGRRLRRIDRNHRSLASGYVTTVNDSGLIVALPERKSSHQVARSLFFCLVILMAFKAFLLTQIGAVAYHDSVALLQNGTIVEKFGAYVMVADPVTVWVSDFLTAILK